jgi:hypothetical protein
MHKFFFNNETLPPYENINEFIRLFSVTLKEYETLATNEQLNVFKGIITEKLPSETTFGYFSLSEVIEGLDNKDLRELAYAYFTKYPIDNHFKIDREERFLEQNYTFVIHGKTYETLYLAYVSDYNGIVFTVPIHNLLKQNILTLKANDDTFIQVNNLYGNEQNTQFIMHHITTLNKAQLSLFDRLLAELENSVYPSSFEKSFLDLHTSEQESIVELFIRAKKRGLKTPFAPDTKIIKDVTPSRTKCDSIYELRVYSPTALRVYFQETSEKIYLATIEKKSNPNQSRDIKKADNTLFKLIQTSR